MKSLLQILFAIAFASSLSALNAPLFDNRKHETFAKYASGWAIVRKGVKANGLQKFYIQGLEVWAVNIEKGIEKICKKLKIDSPKVNRVGDEYHLLLNSVRIQSPA